MIFIFCAYLLVFYKEESQSYINSKKETYYNVSDIPEYSGKPYVYLNNNIPNFNEQDYNLNEFEHYGELDHLGRCTIAFANIGKELMPTEERTGIGLIKPTGWHTIKYDNISGKYLYNRCHLIGYQLTGENANEKNLITCTRQMNTKGKLKSRTPKFNY